MTENLDTLAAIASVATRAPNQQVAQAGRDLQEALADEKRREALAEALGYRVPSKHARRDELIRQLANADGLLCQHYTVQARRIEKLLKQYRAGRWQRDRLAIETPYTPGSVRDFLFRILTLVDRDCSERRLRAILAGQN